MVKEVLKWIQEQSHRKKGEEFIGVTTTMLALLTAGATLAGHRAHTEEVKFQTLATDQWGFYQAKHIRAHMYAIEAEKAMLRKQKKLAARYLDKAIYEQCGDAPVAETCNLEKCRDEAKPGVCSIPVLKDSIGLRKLFVSDNHTFQKYFSAPAVGTGRADPPSQGGGESSAASPRERPCKAAEESTSKPQGALAILSDAKCRDEDVKRTTSEARYEDIAEIILEFSIMICSTALVVGKETYRKTAYLFTAISVGVAGAGVGYALYALHYTRNPIEPSLTIAAAVVVFLSLVVWVLVYARYNDHAKHPAAQGARPEN